MSKAYTLIELLIVIGVLAILTGLASLSLVSFGKASDTETSKTIISGALQEARANSMADVDDKIWGLHFESERVIIFADSGSGYNPSSPTNSVRLIASHNTIAWQLNGGGANLEFAKRTGGTANYGEITITGQSSAVKSITINSQGAIE